MISVFPIDGIDHYRIGTLRPDRIALRIVIADSRNMIALIIMALRRITVLSGYKIAGEIHIILLKEVAKARPLVANGRIALRRIDMRARNVMKCRFNHQRKAVIAVLHITIAHIFRKRTVSVVIDECLTNNLTIRIELALHFKVCGNLTRSTRRRHHKRTNRSSKSQTIQPAFESFPHHVHHVISHFRFPDSIPARCSFCFCPPGIASLLVMHHITLYQQV